MGNMLMANWISVIEVAILVATLLTTVGLSTFIALQARRHFQLQHAKEYIARFNSAEMVRLRDTVDRWLAENPAGPARTVAVCGETEVAVRTFINFFQELGVAWKHRTVHREYTWDLFGGLIHRYWAELAPFCEAQRIARGRATLYRDFENLVGEMKRMDGEWATPGGDADGAGEVYLFGYGSLISPESVARTLGREPDVARHKPVWLSGYERGWTVHDMVRSGADGVVRPTAFLNIAPHAGRRCNGIAVLVKTTDLEGFDRRERCYTRVDVSACVTPPLDRPVFAYVGREPWTTMPEETVVLSKYVAVVEAGLGRWGDGFAADYQASTLKQPWPLVDGDYAFEPHPAEEGT